VYSIKVLKRLSCAIFLGYSKKSIHEICMTVTIKDIAKEVGKSIATVSRALNDYNDISEETKALVRKTAKELGYSPNAAAQRLQRRVAGTIGFILPTFGPRFSDPFFSEFIAGVGNQLSELGIDLLVSTRTPGDQEIDAYREYVQAKRVDGFIVVRTRLNDKRIHYLLDEKFPFVAFGRMDNENEFPFVDEDGEMGMRLIVEHLITLGHKRIGIISSPSEFTFTKYRMKGIHAAFNKAGIIPDHSLIVSGDLTQRGGYQKANDLLNNREKPSAIIAGNDLMAFGAMSAAQERGLMVGKDISITGFDDIPMAEHSHPSLTTINQPIYSIGRQLCEMLVHRITSEIIDHPQVILSPTLIVRGSSGPRF